MEDNRKPRAEQMSVAEIPGNRIHPRQRIRWVRVEDDVVQLEGRSVDIRFPLGWARKLNQWYEGPGRNILCNADMKRFNLVGITKMAEDLLLAFVDRDGGLKAEFASNAFLEVLRDLLAEGET